MFVVASVTASFATQATPARTGLAKSEKETAFIPKRSILQQ
jgi:hypothetical protein